MNSLASLLYLAAFGALAHAVVFPAAPVNISVTPGSTGVQIDWDDVEGAEQYVVMLDGQTQQVLAESSDASFGGLNISTSYSGQIQALDANETEGNVATFGFRTVMSPVEGLKVNAATETSIDIEWMPMNNTNSYEVTVFDTEDIQQTGASVSVSGTSAMISGLEAMTFYKIYVTAVGSYGRSEMATLRTRTDGSGVVMTAFWEGDEQVIGGEGMVYRPLTIPPGIYKIGVQLPCHVAKAKFWNAKLDKDNSEAATGYYQLYQRKSWMRRKAEIGMFFHFGNESTCDFMNNSIAVTFGDNVVSPKVVLPETFTPINHTQQEWADVNSTVESAGWIKFDLASVYHGANAGDETNTTIEKPNIGEFVIVLNTGAGCPGGITINLSWGLTLRNTTGMGVAANMMYFTQEGSQWTDRRPGLVYGYDAAVCPDRMTMEVSVMSGGTMIDTIHKQPMSEMVA